MRWRKKDSLPQKILLFTFHQWRCLMGTQSQKRFHADTQSHKTHFMDISVLKGANTRISLFMYTFIYAGEEDSLGTNIRDTRFVYIHIALPQYWRGMMWKRTHSNTNKYIHHIRIAAVLIRTQRVWLTQTRFRKFAAIVLKICCRRNVVSADDVCACANFCCLFESSGFDNQRNLEIEPTKRFFGCNAISIWPLLLLAVSFICFVGLFVLVLFFFSLFVLFILCIRCTYILYAFLLILRFSLLLL